MLLRGREIFFLQSHISNWKKRHVPVEDFGIESWQGCAAEEFDGPPFYTGVLASKWHPFVRNLESTTLIFLDIPWFILFCFFIFHFFLALAFMDPFFVRKAV